VGTERKSRAISSPAAAGTTQSWWPTPSGVTRSYAGGARFTASSAASIASTAR
jgi:hypothetical protein